MEALYPLTRTDYYDNRSPRSHDDIVGQFTDWWEGRAVLSQVATVGRLVVPEATHHDILKHPTITREPYGFFNRTIRRSPSWIETTVDTWMQGFKHIVETDMATNQLTGKPMYGTSMGNFGSHNIEPLHSDQYQNRVSIRWTSSFGIGPTWGTVGTVARANVLATGDLSEAYTPGRESSALQAIYPAHGEVVRFTNSGDIHASPIAFGGRIFYMATLTLANARVS